MKPFKISGNKNGVNLSIPDKILTEGGAEYFARVVVGNVEGNKTFALQQLIKMCKKHKRNLIINKEVKYATLHSSRNA